MYGDLDESKLIEGLTGEKGIYRRRGDKEPERSILLITVFVAFILTLLCSVA